MKSQQTPADFGFNPDDLKPLGKTFVNDPPFYVEDTPTAFRLLPPRGAGRRNLATWAVVGLFFVGFYVLIDRVADADRRKAGLVFIAVLGVATCGGGYTLVAVRQWRFEQRGPVIDVDKATGRVTIPNGRTFERADVVGLLCCALQHGGETGRLAELNLVAHHDGKRLRFLLLTTLDGSPRAFDYVAKPFVAATGFPAYRIWHDGPLGGLLGRGELRAERIGDRLSV